MQVLDDMIRKALNEGLLEVDAENGKVFSLLKGSRREIKGESNKKGYKRFSFYINGQRCHFRVNRVVYIAQHGFIPEDMMIDHINNDKNDNRICNLQALTNADNIRKSFSDKRNRMAIQPSLFGWER